MKKLTKLPATDLCPTYCEQISETEVIHYKLPHQLMLLNENNKYILEKYFKEEVEIADSEETEISERRKIETVEIPENLIPTKTNRKFYSYLTRIEPTFVQKIKLFANKYLKCCFSVKTIAKAYSVAVKYYDGQEEMAFKQFKESLGLNPIDGWLMKPSIMPLTDSILGTRKAYAYFAYPVRLVDSDFYKRKSLTVDSFTTGEDCGFVCAIEEPITVKEVINIPLPDDETKQF